MGGGGEICIKVDKCGCKIYKGEARNANGVGV